jgi:hypothetical protein
VVYPVRRAGGRYVAGGAALCGEALGVFALRRKVGRDGRARSAVQAVAAASSAKGLKRGPEGNGNG